MFKLDTTPNITKEFIFSKISAEQVFEFYLGVPIKKGNFCSPSILRVDNNPTCSYYRNSKGNLIYKDFAGPTFDCIGLVQHLFSCSYYRALNIIANDFNLVNLPKTEKHTALIPYSGTIIEKTEKSNIQVEIKEFSKKELDWWGKFGISFKTLQKFKVFSIKSVFLNGNYFTSSSESTPIYGYYGGKDSNNIELWRLYMPTKRNYRFLSNWSSSMIQGARQIPKSGDFLVITKSLKDVMSLYEFGITAIAPNSENLFISESQYKKLKMKFKDIYLLYDNDLPGVKSANKIRKKFKDLQVIIIPRRYKAKDFSDFVKRYNLLTTFNLIDEWLLKRKQNLTND